MTNQKPKWMREQKRKHKPVKTTLGAERRREQERNRIMAERKQEQVLLEDGSCPDCGSVNVHMLLSEPPMKCQDCGWRGWSREGEGSE